MLAICSFSHASELAFPEHGFSLNLPGEWHIGDQAVVDEINASMKGDPRTAKVQYYRIIYASEQEPDKTLFPTYILVQIVDAPIAPELFAKMFPTIGRQAEKLTGLFEEVADIKVSMETPVYDPATRTGLMPMKGVDADGKNYRGVSVNIPTARNLICLHVYADVSKADEVFAKVVPALQAASLEREVAMSDDWNAAIEKLLKSGNTAED